MKKYYKYIGLLLFAVTASCGSGNGSTTDPVDPDPGTGSSQTMKTVTYQTTDETFANPERGMYTEIECNLTDAVSESKLKSLRNDGKTLVQLLYYLNGYNDKELPSSGITKISADMGRVRNAGMKVILRFAYTDSETGKDAPMDIILKQMDQLKTVFTNDKDVIACVQAGFIGAWGEWYYSSNSLNNTASYNKVISKWLEVLPADRCVQVRTPKYKQDYIGSATAITEAQAYNGTAIARIAHHNDAFMADESNMGTYTDVTKDKAYLATECLYLPIGGETCLPSTTATPSSGAAALQELQTLHWSFLHDGYDTKVLNQWTKDGVMTTIKNKLGYRIQLTSGEYSTKHIAGSSLDVKLKLMNVGFAAMYNPRKLQLILQSTDGSKTWVATLPEDPRTWKPSKSCTVSESVALPSDIAAGQYKLYLYLPDAESSLAGNPLYAVRLANKDIWNSTTGYNDLGVTIAVSATGNLSASTSSIKFVKK